MWFVHARQRLNRRKMGLVDRPLYADEVLLLEALDGAISRGERLDLERREKQAEIRKKAQQAASLYQ